jgi:hypothetical protein
MSCCRRSTFSAISSARERVRSAIRPPATSEAGTRRGPRLSPGLPVRQLLPQAGSRGCGSPCDPSESEPDHQDLFRKGSSAIVWRRRQVATTGGHTVYKNPRTGVVSAQAECIGRYTETFCRQTIGARCAGPSSRAVNGDDARLRVDNVCAPALDGQCELGTADKRPESRAIKTEIRAPKRPDTVARAWSRNDRAGACAVQDGSGSINVA